MDHTHTRTLYRFYMIFKSNSVPIHLAHRNSTVKTSFTFLLNSAILCTLAERTTITDLGDPADNARSVDKLIFY